MRHSLFKYFSEQKYAEDMLDGKLLFRPLSFFQRYEDDDIRRDQEEGVSNFRPARGLVINNLTQGTTFTVENARFESTAQQNEIFIFCSSRSHSDEKRNAFSAKACVEVLQVKMLCQRIKAALPPHATFKGQCIDYYDPQNPPGARWALPEKIATSKTSKFRWQDEYRLMFALTDALAFENVNLRIADDQAVVPSVLTPSADILLDVGSLRDICRLHQFAS